MAVRGTPLVIAELLLAGHRQIKIRPRTAGNPGAWAGLALATAAFRAHARRMQRRQLLLRTAALAALPAISRAAPTDAGLIDTPV